MAASGLAANDFVAVHWRRGDFLKLSLDDNMLMRLSPQQAGECVAEQMRGAAFTKVFLASNGNASDVRPRIQNLSLASRAWGFQFRV